MDRLRKPGFERLETKRCLAAVSFVRHELDIDALIAVAGDFDSDGDLDLVTVAGDSNEQEATTRIALHKNIDGRGNFGSAQLVDSSLGDANFVATIIAADLDNDADLDIVQVVSSSSRGPAAGIYWYENLDGKGTFGGPATIATVFRGSVSIADLDNDGDVDLLHSSGWYENKLEASRFVEHTTADGTRSALATDIDRDGDLDLVSTVGKDELRACLFHLHENRSENKGFSAPRVIGNWQNTGSCEIYAADLDGDEDADFVATSLSLGQVAWFENDGKAGISEATVISTETAEYHSVFISDLTGDSRPDILVNAWEWLYRPRWYENTPEEIIVEHSFPRVSDADWATNHFQVTDIADINGDGWPDLVARASGWNVAPRVVWLENRLTGDVNGDGEVAFNDYLELSRNFGNTNAFWADGDLTGDGTVAFDDFLILADGYGNSRLKATKI